MDRYFKKGNQYIEEVIRPLLPNVSLGGFINYNYHLSGPGQLLGSIYEKGINENASFLHFTNISNLLEIIRSKKIRMSDFNSFKDRFELCYANNNLVDIPSDFEDLKSCLFALSMCEDNEDNHSYMWEKYGDCGKGICIRLKLDKSKSVFADFYLGKVNYSDTNEISELRELKIRHNTFKSKYGEAIDNLDTILLSACSMYKKREFEKEKEFRLLAYIKQPKNHYHYSSRYPIKHKYNSKKDLIEYFMELELENEKNCLLPFLSIDSIFLEHNFYGDTIGKLRKVIELEFKKSFNRVITVFNE